MSDLCQRHTHQAGPPPHDGCCVCVRAEVERLTRELDETRARAERIQAEHDATIEYRLRAERDAEKAEADAERERMRLAAITVAIVQPDQLEGMLEEYSSASLGDVVALYGRHRALLARVERMEAALREILGRAPSGAEAHGIAFDALAPDGEVAK